MKIKVEERQLTPHQYHLRLVKKVPRKYQHHSTFGSAHDLCCHDCLQPNTIAAPQVCLSVTNKHQVIMVQLQNKYNK